MDIAEQIYGAIDILVNNKIKSINFNTTIDGTIVDASRAKEGRYKVQDETARSFIAYSNQTDYKENDNVLITIPNGDYTEQKIIVGKKVGNVENTSFKYTSPLSTMIPLVRCTLSGSQREWSMYANQNEAMICPILEQDFSQNPLIGYTRIGLTADFSTWLKELNTVEGSYGIVCTCAFAKNGLAGENEVAYELDADMRTVATNFITDTTNPTDNNIEFVNSNYDSLINEVNRVLNVVRQYTGGTPITTNIVQPTTTSNKTILVADDSDIIRNFVDKAFSQEYQVVYAKDGQETINTMQSNQNIVALLLDLNMPNIDGFQVLEYMKGNGLFDKIPVSIITGDDSKDTIDKAFTYPITDVLQKPFDETNVKSVVEKMLALN